MNFGQFVDLLSDKRHLVSQEPMECLSISDYNAQGEVYKYADKLRIVHCNSYYSDGCDYQEVIYYDPDLNEYYQVEGYYASYHGYEFEDYKRVYPYVCVSLQFDAEKKNNSLDRIAIDAQDVLSRLEN